MVVDIVDTLIQAAPNWAGFIVAVYFLWRIASNALHGVANTNKELMSTQVEMVGTLKTISKTLEDHSSSDAAIFNKISENLEKQGDILIRLEERTKNL